MTSEEQSDALEDGPRKMTQEEFAEHTGFSRSTIARWVRDKKIPVFTMNGRSYIRRDLALAWFDQHTSGGMPPERE